MKNSKLEENEDMRFVTVVSSGELRALGADAMASLIAKKDAKVWLLGEPPHVMGEGGGENLWPPLRRAIQDILDKCDSGQSFSDLYRIAHVMVAGGQGRLLHTGLREAVTDYLVNKVRPAVLASAHDDFLRTLNQAWNDHQSRMRRINDIALYLEQRYLPQNKLCSVKNLGLLLFRDEVARHADIRDKLQEMLLQTMSRHREGEMVDRMLIKNACKMLSELSVNSRSVYEEDFERPFLADAEKFYDVESQKLLEKSVIDYIDMTERLMGEESERVKLLLEPSTEPLIQEVVYQKLVANHVCAIAEKEDSGVVAMLKNERVGDLARLFQLLSRAENGRKTVAQCVSKYLRELGRPLMAEDGDKVDSLYVVKELMELKDHFERILNSCFSDKHFVRHIINADFEYILNLTTKAPEHVAAFADAALRKGTKEMPEQEFKQLLDKTVIFARFLHDKDLFERFYKQYLCKRLLHNKIVSIDAERAMVFKLKVACGAMFVSKFETMLNDMSISKKLTEEFRSAIASCRMELHGVDLTVRVLTTGFWPFPEATQQCNIPAAPRDAFETFRRFYLAKHGGRKLDLQPQKGWVDMKAVFYPPAEPSTSSALSTQLSGPRTYVILVTTYQMCVLMLFNSREKITYEDIASETSIPETSLVRALQSLTVGEASEPILVKEPPTDGFESGHVFTVNESFTSHLNRVKIRKTTAKICGGSKGYENVARNVDEDRRFVIEAAIVRVMKSERKLSHSEIVAKVTDLLSERFIPDDEVIKKRIDVLIDRDFLERDPYNDNVYNYVP